jgi:hypothetical protein
VTGAFRVTQVSTPLFTRLIEQDGRRWSEWLGPVAAGDPELRRGLELITQFLEAPELATIKKLVTQYVGHARTLAPATCNKLAYRIRLLQGWLNDPLADPVARIHSAFYALERILPLCPGTHDRQGMLKTAIHDLTDAWLNTLAADGSIAPAIQAGLLFDGMLADQCSLLPAIYWWRALQKTDLPTALALAAQVIERLPVTEPSNELRWRSFSQRWIRLRLRDFLRYVDEPVLLADLLKRSAIDDFEAAQVLELLQRTKRNREALTYGERWLKAYPNSPVLVEAMIRLYREDGWDQEAADLAREQYLRDPHPRWHAYLAAPTSKPLD